MASTRFPGQFFYCVAVARKKTVIDIPLGASLVPLYACLYWCMVFFPPHCLDTTNCHGIKKKFLAQNPFSKDLNRLVTKKQGKIFFAIRGPHLSLGGGGQRGVVKDHTFTFFFWDPSLMESLSLLI